MTQHVYPLNDVREHVTSGKDCWCRLTLQNVCPDCDEREAVDPGCRRCGGSGWVACPSYETPDLVLHNLGPR